MKNVKKILLPLGCAAAALISAGCVPLMAGGVVAGTASVATDRRTTGTQVSDGVIDARVAKEIADQVPSDDSHITVTSYNGKVLLSGEVRTEQEKALAGSIAEKSLDVASVVNELAVQEPVSVTQRLSDSTLATKVRSRILANKNSRLGQMSVVAERGIIYLMGLVTQEEGSAAAEVAARTSGVTQVVKVFEYQTEEEIRARMAALEASPAADTEKTDP